MGRSKLTVVAFNGTQPDRHKTQSPYWATTGTDPQQHASTQTAGSGLGFACVHLLSNRMSTHKRQLPLGLGQIKLETSKGWNWAE
jgi:hypothetical protein